nr:MAG TPA: hypothetical protein [Caudoviricetes sp.]
MGEVFITALISGGFRFPRARWLGHQQLQYAWIYGTTTVNDGTW